MNIKKESMSRRVVSAAATAESKGDSYPFRNPVVSTSRISSIPSALFFRELLTERRLPLRAAGCSLIFCFLYACSDEYHQTFVPGRAGTMIDVAVDMAGVAFGLVLVLLACLKRKEFK